MKELSKPSGNGDWDFVDTSPGYLVHGLHPYPAKMHPLIAKGLIQRFESRNMRIADPFCGSGTTLVESLLAGYDSFGVDLNPLACLISKAKTKILDRKELERVQNWSRKRLSPNSLRNHYWKPPHVNRRFLQLWFKPRIIRDLLSLRNIVVRSELWDSRCKWLLASCISRTTRAVSNQRPFEFKSYRLPKDELDHHNPDVSRTFQKYLGDMIDRQQKFFGCLPSKARNGRVSAEVIQADSRLSQLRSRIDLVVTSPPYGDSDTTVAYEQFSKLASYVLGEELGWHPTSPSRSAGTLSVEFPKRRIFDRISSKVRKIDPVRARVLNQYFDGLQRSVISISQLLRKNGIACIVMGPRTVCGVKVPTPTILQEFAEEQSLELIGSFSRQIRRKVLPRRNDTVTTINQEEILLFRRGR